MNYQGVLTKMTTELSSTVQYYLIFEQDFLHLNQLLDKRISINFLRYSCMSCKRQKKIFRNGYCYNCHTTLPDAGEWIMRPELSQAHLEIDSQPGKGSRFACEFGAGRVVARKRRAGNAA